MVNCELEEFIGQGFAIGDTVTYNCNGTHTHVIVDKTAFSLTVQTATCKLCIPISFTQAYKDAETMAHGPLPAPKPRGRPRKEGPQGAPLAAQAPAANPYLPPGSPLMAVPVRQTVTAPAPQTQPPLEAISGVTYGLASGDADWIGSALDEATESFKLAMHDLVLSIQTQAQDAASQGMKTAEAMKPPARLFGPTCADCVNVDLQQGICSKFNATPPMFVIVSPVGKCNEFVDMSDEIPF